MSTSDEQKVKGINVYNVQNSTQIQKGTDHLTL